jgi:homoaconitate hydratase
VGTPVVRTDAAAIWATGEFWWQIPRTVQVELSGKLPRGATGKDVIITLCGRYNHEEVLNAAVEFGGPGVATLSLDERMSIANMTTEWGALVGFFPADEVTLAWIRARLAQGVTRVTPAQLDAWSRERLGPDAGASYAARITLDLGSVTPHVSGPDTVQTVASLAELAPKQIRINKAYLLSCVNSRLSDLEAAAGVLRGKKIATGVTLYLAAASRTVEEAAKQSGAWQALIDAGAVPLPPSCGPCIGLGTGLLEKGEVGISATNRNFKGRMGARDARCYLASPAVVAASAAAGYLCGPESSSATQVETRYEALTPPAAGEEKVEILPGFPATLRGRLVFAPQDNLNTDGIYGKDYTYRDDMTPEMMAKVVMENYDPQFAGRTRAGDLLVGGFNFGTGSSREQAATALKAKGIAVVVAGTFSQTYQRNAFNNGYPVVECPELVAHLRQLFAAEIGRGEKTLISGDELDIDFTRGVMTHRGRSFRFGALGGVPQALVIAGGVENQVRKRLGLA